MRRFAAALDINQKDKFLSLDRAENKRRDELDQIALSMNQMKQDLIDDATQREQYNN